MTLREYIAYEKAVSEFFEREGLENLSSLPCEDDEGNMIRSGEPYFSSRPCECCHRHLGGDREDCDGYNPTTGEVQGPYSVCEDCVYYASYGRLGDMTMWDIEKEEERINSAYCMMDLGRDTPWHILYNKLVEQGMEDEAEFVMSVYGDDNG